MNITFSYSEWLPVAKQLLADGRDERKREDIGKFKDRQQP